MEYYNKKNHLSYFVPSIKVEKWQNRAHSHEVRDTQMENVGRVLNTIKLVSAF